MNMVKKLFKDVLERLIENQGTLFTVDRSLEGKLSISLHDQIEAILLSKFEVPLRIIEEMDSFFVYDS